jgi:hypothetical protein
MSLTEALLKWMSNCFEVSNLTEAKSCSNGVKCAQILKQIDTNHFNTKWVSTVKVREMIFIQFCKMTNHFQDDIPNDNVRLKANNIKKVLNGMTEYYSEVLGLQMNDFPSPDVVKVAEGSQVDTGNQLYPKIF